MIRLIVKLGAWLDRRFPAKVVVTAQQYEQLHTELSMVRGQMADTQASLDKALSRLSVVESNAVHKGAVQELVKVVEELKTEQMSFKASLGFTPRVNSEIQAMINGEPL